MGKKLTVYLIDGKEFGPKIIEIGNWVGKGLSFSRASLINYFGNRSEFNNPGIYFLKSSPTNEFYDDRIYIGEAENIGNRIKQHLNDASKDFSEVAFFISKDELLTKSQIKYLESRIINLARDAKASEIENGTSPTLPTLHEADISDMEYFIEQIKLILPLFGFNFLKQSTFSRPITIEGNINNISNLFFIKNSNFDAEMIVTNEGFIVKEGSQANKRVTQSLTDNYKKLRSKLIDTGILIEQNDFYIFSEDTVFTSPSAASNMVLGRQSPGPIEWVDKTGKTYKEIYES